MPWGLGIKIPWIPQCFLGNVWNSNGDWESEFESGLIARTEPWESEWDVKMVIFVGIS